jgi:hypothetical protein
MRKKKLSILLTIIFAIIIVFSSGIFSGQQTAVQQVAAQGPVLPYTVATYGNAWDGILAFGVNGYLVVMRTNGTLLDVRTATSNYGVVKNIAQDTLLFQGEPQTTTGANSAPIYATHIWNVVSNTTQDYPNVLAHHDIEYDPINNSFITLQEYVRQVGNNSYLMDRIVQVDTSGNTLWSWDTYDHLPLSQASPFNETSTISGQTVIDFTHSNALLWEPNNNIIYLNVRNANTFYKINETTGDIIWSCGQFGNFTLLDQNGTVVPNLWYHSHHLQQIAPNVFTMFNNDFNNLTNPNDANSQLIQFTIDQQNMTASLNWSWTAPQEYYSQYLGANYKLPNGDWIGDFGPPTHQFPQNQPWNFNNTGAVLIEVSPAGQIVRTITFPTSWSIYRIEVVTNLSQNAFSYTSQPTPYPSPTPILLIQTPTIAPTKQPSPSPSPSPTQTFTNGPSHTPISSTNSQINLILISLIIGIVIVSLTVGMAYLRKKKNHKTNHVNGPIP